MKTEEAAQRRIPVIGSRWVWEIDQERGRALIEVLEVFWNGEEWWVRTRTLPEAPIPMLAPLTDTQDHLNELDRFWEAVTPVGGRVEDLSRVAEETP
jgi:hypothetical protein